MDKKRSNLKVAILGGSFDPPHIGHLQVIKQALKNGLIDEAWLMPCFENPWNKCQAPAEDRFKMCKLLEEKGIKTSDIEIKRWGISYTIDTVRELKKKFVHQFFWLIGSDHLKDIEKFKDADKLLKETIFIAFPRTNLSSSEIRERIKKELPVTGLVPKKVEEYIRKHKLYV